MKGLQPVEVGGQDPHTVFTQLLSVVLPTGSILEGVAVIFTVTTSLVLMCFLVYY